MKVKQKIIDFLLTNKDNFYTEKFGKEFLTFFNVELSNNFFMKNIEKENPDNPLFSLEQYSSSFRQTKVFKPRPDIYDINVSFIFVFNIAQYWNFEIIFNEEEFVDLDIPNNFIFQNVESFKDEFKVVKEIMYGKKYNDISKNDFTASRPNILEPYRIKNDEDKLFCETGLGLNGKNRSVRIETIPEIFPVFFTADFDWNIIELGFFSDKLEAFYNENEITDYREIDDKLKDLYDLNNLND